MSTYFAYARQVGRVKIGKSYDPERRVRQGLSFVPVPITLIGWVEDDWQEPILHEKLRPHKCSDIPGREWFHLTNEVVAAIIHALQQDGGIRQEAYEMAADAIMARLADREAV